VVGSGRSICQARRRLTTSNRRARAGSACDRCWFICTAAGGHPEADCRRWGVTRSPLRLAGVPERTGAVRRRGAPGTITGRGAHHATMAAINALRDKYGRRVQLWGNTLIGFSEGRLRGQ